MTWQRDEPESPCINVCVIHPIARICAGCYRSIEEIGAWRGMTPEARRAVMVELPGRAGALKARRGGRKGRAPSL